MVKSTASNIEEHLSDSVETPTAHPPLEHTASESALRRLRNYGSALLLAGTLLLCLAYGIERWATAQTEFKLAQLQTLQSQLHQELNVLTLRRQIPEPIALQGALVIGKAISQHEASWLLQGQLYQQKLQHYATQLIETLSRPVSGLDSDLDNRIQRESALRLEAFPRLEKLFTHLQKATQGVTTLITILGLIPALAGLFLLGKWANHKRIDDYKRRINTLSRAIHSQTDLDMQRLGASTALESLMAVMEKTRNIEHRQALMQIGQQLEDLKESGHRVLGFANSFHRLSSHATHLARHALTNEQRNQKADGTIDLVKAQLEGLREDMRNAAQGLRKAGQVSRQLMANLQNPEQLELDLTDPNLNSLLQNLVDQSQKALREAIEGMVLASQKINMGQFETNRLAEHLAVNHTAWSNLLEEIEHHAETASQDSSEALKLAKRLIENSRDQAELTKREQKALPTSGSQRA